MGRQIRFYMTEEDEHEFLEFARESGDVLIVPQTTDKEVGETFLTFKSLVGRRLGDGCHLWNRSISPKPILEFVEAHGGCYCLDFLQSEVIKILRSKIVDKRLGMGRLHIEESLQLPNGSIVSKGREFINWYNDLRRWIAKRFIEKFDSAYLSTRSRFLYERGFELTGHIL